MEARKVYHINGQDVRLIMPSGKMPIDEWRWKHFVLSTPPTDFKPVTRHAQPELAVRREG